MMKARRPLWLVVGLASVSVFVNLYHGVQISVSSPSLSSSEAPTQLHSNKLDWRQHKHPNNSSDYLLSAPFYVYEEFGSFNSNLTLNGVPFSESNKEWKQLLNFKHADDLLFTREALRHPMRTTNPQEAKLFLVPSFFNIVNEMIYQQSTLCFESKCNLDILPWINHELGQSPWFHRNSGKDHVFVASHWMWKRGTPKHYPSDWIPNNLIKCHLITFEDQCQDNSDCTFNLPSYYNGIPCNETITDSDDHDNNKLYDFVFVATLKNSTKKRAKFGSRQDLCDWISQDTSYSMPVCGFGSQCPVLSQAKFGFHVRGDTFGANRLMDTILSGTVPIFTHRRQYEILPDWIDWKQLSYFADLSNATIFLKMLNDIVADTQLYESKLQAVHANKKLFDYHSHVPFDTYIYMLQCKLWPELKRTQATKYSALILPS